MPEHCQISNHSRQDPVGMVDPFGCYLIERIYEFIGLPPQRDTAPSTTKARLGLGNIVVWANILDLICLEERCRIIDRMYKEWGSVSFGVEPADTTIEMPLGRTMLVERSAILEIHIDYFMGFSHLTSYSFDLIEFRSRLKDHIAKLNSEFPETKK